MDAAAELRRNPVSKHQTQPEYGDEQAGSGRNCLPNPSRKTKFSGANADREMFIFPRQLTTSRIGNLTRLIHTLAICVTIYTYIELEDLDQENSQKYMPGTFPSSCTYYLILIAAERE